MLTWNQFKAAVDKILEEKGLDPNTEIWYIDCSSGIGWGRDNPDIHVGVQEYKDGKKEIYISS